MSPSLQQQSLCPVTLGTLFLEIFDERIHWRRSVSVFVSVQIMGNKFSVSEMWWADSPDYQCKKFRSLKVIYVIVIFTALSIIINSYWVLLGKHWLNYDVQHHRHNHHHFYTYIFKAICFVNLPSEVAAQHFYYLHTFHALCCASLQPYLLSYSLTWRPTSHSASKVETMYVSCNL